MTKAAIITPSSGDAAIVASYLRPEQVQRFHVNLDTGQRLGQAFMNALDEEYAALTGSVVDPFHFDDLDAVLKAVDWLTLARH